MNGASLVSEFWTIVGGALTLKPEAFRAAVESSTGWYVTTAVVLLAGLSEAIGQSVVLFANKVKPSRFVFCLFVNAVLFAFGYLFAGVSTWAIMQLPGQPHVAFGDLAVVLALSYLPMLFAFLVALPYLGYGLGWLLKTLHLLAMVVGVSAISGLGPFGALLDVGLGWLVLSIAQQTIGKPVAVAGEKLLSAVAGVNIIADEQLALEHTGAVPAAVDGGAARAAQSSASIMAGATSHSPVWKIALGLGFMLVIGYVCALTLAPVHHAAFGWQERLPKIVQLPLNLFWIAIIGVLVAGFMAPLETLGWWAGWYGGDVRTALSRNAAATAAAGDHAITRFIVYLDGISQSGERYTPDVEAFLDALASRLPRNMRLIRGVMTYSVINRPLDDDPILSWFWRWVDKLRFANPASLLGMFVNLRNVLIVAVSADSRYGQIYNYGIAQLVYGALTANGYRRGSGTPVTFIGYSGGGQMAAACAAYVRRAIDAPVDVISLGGVISGNCRILETEHLYHFVGDKDGVQRLGPAMFPSRWKIAVISNWNRALRLGRLSIFGLGPVGHNVPGGMMDPELKLPDGRSALEQTLEKIDSVLAGRIERAASLSPAQPNNYARYAAAAYGSPPAFPIAAAIDRQRYVPVADWVGRLILPTLAERTAEGGCWFEVHHAPPGHATFAGRRVRLLFGSDRQLGELVRAVTRDVHFSAEAEYASRRGLVTPVRLDHRQLVDPLESLAGAHPADDLIVALRGSVTVDDAGAQSALRITRLPLQITGRYRGLVQLLGPSGSGFYEAVHFDRTSRGFDGPRERLRMPDLATSVDGRAPAATGGFEHLGLNTAGWYVYGAPDSAGAFTVSAMLPRAILSPAADRTIARADAYRFVRHEAWREIAAGKGSAFAARLGEARWSAGDRALVTHVSGGIGGPGGEREAASPLYFGQFAYGTAEVVWDELAGEPRFDIVYEQICAHNTDGLVAGAMHMSRYLGDRQFGVAGLRPTLTVLLKLDAFTGDFALGDTRRGSALDGLTGQLEAMSARYRIGDGTGVTQSGPANNCSQDSNRALFGALEGLDRFTASDAFAAWKAANPAEAARFEQLTALAADLRRKLQPFGAPRRDWSDNQFNIGSTMTDDPIEQIRAALGSWRVIVPRLANDAIVRTFLKHGACGFALATAQIGDRPGLMPVAPRTLL
jgi:predicted Abi (CAAX) family protease